MNFGIFGLIDIIFLIGLVIAILTGYFTGFMKKMISKFGFIAILIFSFMFASSFAQLLKSANIIYPDIHFGFTQSLENYCTNYNPTSLPSYSVVIEKGFGVVEPFATILKFLMGNPSFYPEEGKNIYQIIITQGADKLSISVMILISFLFLFIINLVLLLSIKAIAQGLRKNKVIRFVDGFLGVLLMVALYIVAVAGIFFVMKLIRDGGQWSSFNDFIDTDLQLNTNNFRISKGIYNANIYEHLKNFIVGMFNR
jgi:hypothetical protein